MIEQRPAYYDDFACLASACPDSCCHEWEVDIDDLSAALYRSLPGKLGDALRAALRDEDGSTYMTIKDSRCPMWREDGLCRIQCELGHDALSKTCREYPRLRHDYGDFQELGLELSCPAAAELILRSPKQVLLSAPLPGDVPGDYDGDCMAILLRSRETLLHFWESADYSVPQMLAVTFLYALDVQSEIDGGEVSSFCPEGLLQRAASLARPGDICGIFARFGQLEILTDRWRTRLVPANMPCWRPEMRNFVRYGILRYYLQAVSDYDLLCRVKWLIVSALLLAYMDGDFLQNAQLFSKEIENNRDTMDTLWDDAYTCPAFSDLGLLGLLLEANPVIIK